MKTVKLKQEEIDVILRSLSEEYICKTQCYCGYKTDMCDNTKSDGTPACKLKQTIKSIEDKLYTQD